MIVVVNKYLLAKGFAGISLWPFVVIRDKALARDAVFLNHERIHLRQQAELLVVLFYLWYLLEFTWRYFQHRDFYLAYRNISFEKEAYSREKDLNYCKSRNFWNFVDYLKEHKD